MKGRRGPERGVLRTGMPLRDFKQENDLISFVKTTLYSVMEGLE